MPIYEFYCGECNRIFNFFSATVNTEARPMCPRCRKIRLSRMMSRFSTIRHRGEETEAPVDDARLERVVDDLARQAENLDENDPRQAAKLMRSLTQATGMHLGPRFEEALSRLENGEDPASIEADLGDLLDEEPFQEEERGGGRRKSAPSPPSVDDTLYFL